MTHDVDHLIIVPCHGVYKLGELPHRQQSWHMADFQLEGNDHLCFLEHLDIALKELEKNFHAYLIISGGETKKEAGPISEAFSYYAIIEKQVREEIGFDRVTTENYARDSFENVIFLICRFYEVFKRYPEYITIIGFEFKRERFLNLHLSQALRFPRDRVYYIGNSPNPNHLTKEEKDKYFEDLRSSEYRNAVQEFRKDWYGVQDVLMSKKEKRNPYSRLHGYTMSNGPIREFLCQISGRARPESNEVVHKALDDAPWT